MAEIACETRSWRPLTTKTLCKIEECSTGVGPLCFKEHLRKHQIVKPGIALFLRRIIYFLFQGVIMG